MAKTVNTTLGSALMKFTFTDLDGDVFAAFKLNPADVRLVGRCEEIAKFMEELANRAPDGATVQDAIKYNNELEDKFNYLLGYDAKPSLFGMMSATTILPDGRIFAAEVLEKIVEAVEPELQKRNKRMQTALDKHTAKYKQ